MKVACSVAISDSVAMVNTFLCVSFGSNVNCVGNTSIFIRASWISLFPLQEGKQASLAADFSLTQFRYVGRLLMVHGRNSYKSSASLSHFVMHRGLIISVMQAIFSSLFYFSSVALYQGVLTVG